MKPHSLKSFAISVLCWLRSDPRELGDCLLLLESVVKCIYDSLLEDDTDNEAIFLDILANMTWICDLDTSGAGRVCVCGCVQG